MLKNVVPELHTTIFFEMKHLTWAFQKGHAMIFYLFSQLFNYFQFLWYPVLQLSISASLKNTENLPNVLSAFQSFLPSPWLICSYKQIHSILCFSNLPLYCRINWCLLSSFQHWLAVIASPLPAAACPIFPLLELLPCVLAPLSTPKWKQDRGRKKEKLKHGCQLKLPVSLFILPDQSAALGCVFQNGGLKAVVGMLALLLG